MMQESNHQIQENTMGTFDNDMFECLDFFSGTTNFGGTPNCGDKDDHNLPEIQNEIRNKSASTFDVIQDTLYTCDDLDNHFGIYLSSVRDTSGDVEDGCTVISEDCDDQSSAGSEMDAMMLKLNVCMQRSAETRVHVERIADILKKTGALSSASAGKTASLPVARSKNAGPSTVVDVSQKRRLPKNTKVVTKRKDFAITGCLVRPILLDEKVVSFPSRQLFTAANGKSPIASKQISYHVPEARTSVSDFLRQSKRSVPMYC
ncbi:hypothetical protein IV203_004079 [Nitzschia inconspicua]|uniref:Uncharacterized protein n=1 Tax=Nitzschia inconspicua TaxID=303405 RepID=A0A9K3L4X9_9STRA|nr:hypothetical protein IV203_004079 [Nitzschia inconspicua]